MLGKILIQQPTCTELEDSRIDCAVLACIEEVGQDFITYHILFLIHNFRNFFVGGGPLKVLTPCSKILPKSLIPSVCSHVLKCLWVGNETLMRFNLPPTLHDHVTIANTMLA